MLVLARFERVWVGTQYCTFAFGGIGQLMEIALALEASGRPFICAVRSGSHMASMRGQKGEASS